MKKSICLFLAMVLCAAIFVAGCSEDAVHCLVMCVKDDEIFVWVPDIGNVYVKYVDSGLEIDPLDTVVMKFDESDLEAASGTYTNFFGEEETYLYILETPKSIRLTRPGEETYG